MAYGPDFATALSRGVPALLAPDSWRYHAPSDPTPGRGRVVRPSVHCVDDLAADAENACGGCAPLDAVPGEPCGACDTGVWVCDPEDESVSCVGERPSDGENACGGCTALDGAPGDPCGTCDTGAWTCAEDGESVTCAGDLGEVAENACGGCASLDASPGDPCGACDGGTWSCADDGDSLLCEGAGAENACGGCTPLAGTPGDACGACDSGAWTCAGHREAVVCSGDLGAEAENACGGCVTLTHSPGVPCGTCDSGEWTCAGDGESVACAGDLGADAENACGGCVALDGSPGDACGDCGDGVFSCDGTDGLRRSCGDITYEWVSSPWSACPLNAWEYSHTGSCSAPCGPGTATDHYTCPTTTNEQTRTVECRRSDGTVVADENCAGPRPPTVQGCAQSSCARANPSHTTACNDGACVSCPSQTISVPTGAYGGAVCTDTLPAYECPRGATVWSPRSWGDRCRGEACLIASGCGDTPYHGTVEGGTAGTCLNYCAVRATCGAAGWADYDFTW